MVQFFFTIGFVEPGLNSNFMMLLPKVLNALVLDKF